MQQRVGHLTVGAALLFSGLWYLLINLGVLSTAPLLIRLWPLLPMGLGVEYLLASRGGQRVSFGGAGVLVLVITGALFVSGGFNFGPPGRLNLVQELSAADLTELRLRTGNARLEVYPRPGNEILVEARVSSSVSSLANQASEGVLTLQPQRGLVHQLVLGMPPHLALNIEGGTGSIQVTGLSGPVDVTTSTGNIELNDLSGPLWAESRTGTVRVHLADRYPELANLSSQTGNLHLWLNRASAQIRAETNTGSINGPSWLAVNQRGAGADAAGTSGAGQGRIQLTTSTGNIKIYD